MILSDKNLNHDMQEIETKIRRGDPVTDDELSMAVKFYKSLADHLDCLGPRWYITGNEARRLFNRCSQYQEARKPSSPFSQHG